jgi:hypothetical protein
MQPAPGLLAAGGAIMPERSVPLPTGYWQSGPLDSGLAGTGRIGDDLWLIAHHDVTGKRQLPRRQLGLTPDDMRNSNVMNSVMNGGTASADLDGGEPRRWVRLMIRLRGQIVNGTFAPGTPLPSIDTLVNEHRYSRQTCSKALRQLESDGLAARIPGLGYYVTDANPAGNRHADE